MPNNPELLHPSKHTHGIEDMSEIISIMSELSEMLGCDLDEAALKASLELLNAGVHPGALAAAILELRKQVDHI